MTQPISSQQFGSQTMSGVQGASAMGAANMSVPTLGAGSTMPAKSSMSQSNWNLASKSVGLMKSSGRNESFIQQHLGQEMAMQSPNWGLNPAQGAQTRKMISSGRSGSFVQSKLGATTPKPKGME